MAAEQVTMTFDTTSETDMKALATFVAEMQRQGGEMLITRDGELIKVVLLGL